MIIKCAQKTVDIWIKKYGIRYFDILTNMILLTEEVGEVARIISRCYGEQSFKKNEKKISLNDLGNELSDVMFVLFCIANQLNIDLEKNFYKNIILKTKRDRYRYINKKNIISIENEK